MENFAITISLNKQVHHFEVGEYLHHDGESCKFRVFENGAFVASFEPGDNSCLQVCQNPGGLGEKMLHLLADKIEAHHPMGKNNHVKKLNV